MEDQATFDMLKEFGVDAVQGYFLEKPRADHPLLKTTTRVRNANLELKFT